MLSARFLHCNVTTFPFVINICGERLYDGIKFCFSSNFHPLVLAYIDDSYQNQWLTVMVDGWWFSNFTIPSTLVSWHSTIKHVSWMLLLVTVLVNGFTQSATIMTCFDAQIVQIWPVRTPWDTVTFWHISTIFWALPYFLPPQNVPIPSCVFSAQFLMLFLQGALVPGIWVLHILIATAV